MATASTAIPTPFPFSGMHQGPPLDILSDLEEDDDPPVAPKVSGVGGCNQVFNFGQTEKRKQQEVFVFGGSGKQPEAPPVQPKAKRAPVGGKRAQVSNPPVSAWSGSASHTTQATSTVPQPRPMFSFGLQTPNPAATPAATATTAFQFGGSSSSSSGPFAQAQDPQDTPGDAYNAGGNSSADPPFVFGLFNTGPSQPQDPSSTSGTQASSLYVEAALKKAQSHVREGRADDAVQACVNALDGPRDLVDVLQSSVKSWQQEERKRVLENENERGRLMTQLMDARERVEKLREVKEKKELEANRERRLRIEAENKIASLQNRLHSQTEVLQENHRLRQQLSKAESKARVPAAPTKQDIIRELAKLECHPLKACSSDERTALKRKLLLKWHPDKQPSADHSSLATAVMQELQNRSEWSW